MSSCSRIQEGQHQARSAPSFNYPQSKTLSTYRGSHIVTFLPSLICDPRLTFFFQNIIHPTSLLRIRNRSEILKCKVCQNTSSPSASCRLHACLHCVYIACYEYSHIKTHLRKSNHPLAIDVSIT